MIRENITETVNTYLPDTEVHDNWNIDGLRDRFMGFLTTEDDLRYKDLNELALVEKNDIIDELVNKALDIYAEKDKLFGEEMMREVERVILLKNVDRYWMDHIDNMDELKKGIYLRSYGQRDPVVEYRMEGFEMFDAMVAAIREDTVRMLLTIQIRTQEEPKREQVAKPTVAVHGDSDRSIRKEPVHVKKSRPQRPLPLRQRQKI